MGFPRQPTVHAAYTAVHNVWTTSYQRSKVLLVYVRGVNTLTNYQIPVYYIQPELLLVLLEKQLADLSLSPTRLALQLLRKATLKQLLHQKLCVHGN